ncbi:hypothetical protein JRQ81_002939 [Phrynocephalus forsythii]|uniref:Uncharacterized protein n=1 Tax=Phrynocephalus forsythii TaxID=171643 RepID=A0A9Q0XJ95_9SAUR|nr:hypothetical protein JRQ81_002939 [Phrynocephalus forsythii]
MLRRAELLMCGKGTLSARSWEPDGAYVEPEGPAWKARQQQQQQQQSRRVFGRGGGRGGGGGRPGWQHRRRGRTPRFSRAHGRHHYYYHHHQQQQHPQAKAWPRCHRPTRPRVMLSLRPVNLMGQRAPGMRAPRNTNQFLMREKYQLMHLRSDSVGTESGGSDCEMDPLDMDSYLGVLENARGALLDGPLAPHSPEALARRPPAQDAAAAASSSASSTAERPRRRRAAWASWAAA